MSREIVSAKVMMGHRTKLTARFVLGIAVARAPILGTLPTVIGTVIAFNIPEQGGREAELLKERTDIGLLLTWTGISVCPAGIAIAVVSAAKLSRIKNSQNSGRPSQLPDPRWNQWADSNSRYE